MVTFSTTYILNTFVVVVFLCSWRAIRGDNVMDAVRSLQIYFYRMRKTESKNKKRETERNWQTGDDDDDDNTSVMIRTLTLIFSYVMDHTIAIRFLSHDVSNYSLTWNFWMCFGSFFRSCRRSFLHYVYSSFSLLLFLLFRAQANFKSYLFLEHKY